LSTPIDIDNRATLSWAVCGWKQPHLPLEWVRRYWRDVHSPAIARRDGIYAYRHLQFDPVRTDLFTTVAGIDFACPADQQLMWLSDMRYLDGDALARFAASPDAEVRGHLLRDIDRIVDRSTTYRTVGENARTLVDDTGIASPAGPPANPTFGLFMRAFSEEARFRASVRRLARRWAAAPGVLRVRFNLFEVPRPGAGSASSLHPLEMQYQAWIELVLRDEQAAFGLLSPADHWGDDIGVIHAYPTRALYSFVHEGRPTLIGLRGYPAYEAINALEAYGHTEPSVLNWMYGSIQVRAG
jgi:hypothetical protein